MLYQNNSFQLDTESRKVFDKNGKELHITGNAYRMLAFLCEKKNATLTEIGDHLDWAKDYTENHLRQYRYKINTIIGSKVIDYKNKVYFIKGEIKQTDEIKKNELNTDLLHSNSVKSEKKEFIMKLYKPPAIVVAIILLLFFIDWPYAYYNFLRIIVSATALYYAFYLHTIEKKNFGFWALIGIVILFNPIIPIYLYEKSIWGVIDIVTAIFFIILIIYLIKNDRQN